jgi:hypothetical protein
LILTSVKCVLREIVGVVGMLNVQLRVRHHDLNRIQEMVAIEHDGDISILWRSLRMEIGV